jgi:hypothetical protein
MPAPVRALQKAQALRRPVLGMRDAGDDEGRKQEEGREQQPGRQDARHGNPFAVSPPALFGRTRRRGKGLPTNARRFSTNASPIGQMVNIRWRILAPFPRECGSIQTRRLGVGERIVIASDHARSR